MSDFDRHLILAVVSQMQEPFYTTDVANHPDILAGHPVLCQHTHYRSMMGRYLSGLTDQDGQPVLQRVGERPPGGVLWQRRPGAKMPPTSEVAVPAQPRCSIQADHARGSIVREGHFRTLEYMASQEFSRIKALLEQVPEFGGVYFRPTDGGVTLVDLHSDSPKPRIGIGEDPLLRVGTTAGQIEPTIPRRIDYLQRVRARQKRPSRENQFEAYLIRNAQASHLIMPGFPDRLRFIHSQWRNDASVGGSQRFPDLIAVDLQTESLVLIELKADADESALPQVRSYLAYFQEHAAELNPFFLRLAQVMGRLYGCPELTTLRQVQTVSIGLVAWPNGQGAIVVRGLDEFDWLNVASSAAKPDVPTQAQVCVPDQGLDLGPQYAGDTPFAARMRRHQSWYRAAVLGVPYGTGPGPQDTKAYGNMLRNEDGCRGLNFLSPRIFEVVQQRLADGQGAVEPFRLLHNMLSSQPMCFNLFGPLVADPELATRLWSRIFPDEVARVTRVAIEYTPVPADEYLADRTAFDAFIEYFMPDGRLAYTGIETKLTEPFSRQVYDGPAYRRWVDGPDSPWRPDVAGQLSHERHNQLWRDHLLVVAMLRHSRSPYARGRLLLVRHALDSECASVAQGYQTMLRDGDNTLVDMTLDKMVAVWQSAIANSSWSDWLSAFRLRYLDLHQSEAARGR